MKTHTFKRNVQVSVSDVSNWKLHTSLWAGGYTVNGCASAYIRLPPSWTKKKKVCVGGSPM